MAQEQSEWALSDVGGWFGGLLKDGMAGYIEVEKAKAGSAGSQAASQDATFDSPNVNENPTAKNGQALATTANGGAIGTLVQNPTALYIAGGLALVGAFLLIKRR